MTRSAMNQSHRNTSCRMEWWRCTPSSRWDASYITKYLSIYTTSQAVGGSSEDVIRKCYCSRKYRWTILRKPETIPRNKFNYWLYDDTRQEIPRCRERMTTNGLYSIGILISHNQPRWTHGERQWSFWRRIWSKISHKVRALIIYPWYLKNIFPFFSKFCF